MAITVQVRNVYGNEVIYPVCKNAELLARLAGTKTLTRDSIAVIKALGYTVNVQQAAVSL